LKTKLVLAGILVVVVVVVAGVWLMSGHSGASTNEKIEIPQGGAQVLNSGKLATLTVHNVGSVTVTIVRIYVNDVAYNYSPTPGSGMFSASSNQIAPGQTATFTVTPATTVSTQVEVFQTSLLHFKAVTAGGAEANADVSQI
jgi:hypothetical protein